MTISIYPSSTWLDNTQQNSVPANDNSLRAEIQVIPITATRNAPLGSEAENTVLLVGTAPTGAFAGWANRLVLKKSGVWIDFTVTGEVIKFHIGLNAFVVWEGTAWMELTKFFGGKGADMASAATVTLANATAEYIHITGSTTIDSFGAAKTGLERTTVFDAPVTLTNSANLINITNANITAAAGDVARWRHEGGGIWRMISYQRANGYALAVDPAGMDYKGPWNASTNTPTLANGVGNHGDFYRVSVAGTRDLGAGSVDYGLGDTLVYNSASGVWDHFDNSQAPVTGAEVISALGYTPQRFYEKITDLGDVSGAVNIDFSLGTRHRLRLVGNVTLTWTGLPPAGYLGKSTLQIIQDGTGGRTVTFPASGKWPMGVVHVASTGIDQQDRVAVEVFSDGSYDAYPVEDMN